MIKRNLTSAMALSTLSIAIHSAVFAASTDEDWEIEKIEVTAQKRAQAAQDVPITLTTFSDDFIEQAGASDFKGLINLTPGFAVAGGDDLAPAPYIRGIGSADPSIGSDPSIGIFIDGIYASRRGGSITDFMDVKRIEILKGPQGTLFGRNAIGGAISITTQDPTNEFAGKISTEIGNYNSRVLKGLINLPIISDELFVRASAVVRQRDGWLHNEFNGDNYADRDRTTGNLKFIWFPSDEIEIKLANSWSEIDELSRTYKAISTPAGFESSITELTTKTVNTGGRHLYGNSELDIPVLKPTSKRDLRSHSLSVEVDISDELMFTSLTSYRFFDVHTSGSFAGGEVHTIGGFGDEKNTNTSQEFRLNGSYDNVNWFLGLSATAEESNIDETYILSDLSLAEPFNLNSIGPLSGGTIAEIQRAQVDTDSWAIFGDISWEVTDRFELIFGARYSQDKKTVYFRNPQQQNGSSTLSTLFAAIGSPLGGIDGLGFVFGSPAQFTGSREKHDKWSDFSPRVVVSYDLNDDIMLFSSVTKGYKSGGFNATGPVNRNLSSPELGFVSDTATDSFAPETVTNYELGVKSSLLNGRLNLNSTVYSYDYEDLQVFVINNSIAQIENAGKASAKGFELDVNFHISPTFAVLANAAWSDAVYDEFYSGDTDLSGTDQLFSPKWSGSIAFDYKTPIKNQGQIRSFISLAYTGEHLVDSEYYQQDAYKMVNARVSYTTVDEKWEFSVFANNVTDETYVNTYANSGGLWGFAGAQRNDPRMYGISATYHF